MWLFPDVRFLSDVDMQIQTLFRSGAIKTDYSFSPKSTARGTDCRNKHALSNLSRTPTGTGTAPGRLFKSQGLEYFMVR